MSRPRTLATASLSLVVMLAGCRSIPPTVQPRRVAPAHDAAFALLRDLPGTWRTGVPGRLVEEHWTAPVGRAMTGTFRSMDADGMPQVLELIVIVAGEDGGLEMRLRHFDSDLQPWEAERDGPLVLRADPPTGGDGDGDGVLRFRAVAADAPVQEIRYDLSQASGGDGRLDVAIIFAGATEPGLRLAFTRQSTATR